MFINGASAGIQIDLHCRVSLCILRVEIFFRKLTSVSDESNVMVSNQIYSSYNKNALVISFQRHYSFRIALDSISIPFHCLHLLIHRISSILIHFSSICLGWNNWPMYTTWIIKYSSSQDVVSFEWIHGIIESNLSKRIGL